MMGNIERDRETVNTMRGSGICKSCVVNFHDMQAWHVNQDQSTRNTYQIKNFKKTRDAQASLGYPGTAYATLKLLTLTTKASLAF